jgi:hypothetical protein
MGDMADYDIEQGEDMWFDHLHDHPRFDGFCPYCYEEELKNKKRKQNE